MPSTLLTRIAPWVALLALFLVSACSTSDAASSTPPTSLRLGYFPNVTHAQPIVGVARGTIADAMGPDTKLQTTLFNAGPSAIEALFANAIDAAYIGPNPTINGYVRSGGQALKVVAGAASGGALFIVRADSGIISVADLAGKKIATPQLGNTQDVAFRAYLQANGLNAREQGGQVEVIPTENSQILLLFQQGEIHGAWVPEPWATRLVKQAGGRIFLDERDLWPGHEFPTTLLVVRKQFLDRYPSVVEKLLLAHVDTTQWINANPAEARQIINDGIRQATGASLPQDILDAAWQNFHISYDPQVAAFTKSADDAFRLGFLGAHRPDLSGIYALDSLTKALQDKGLPSVGQ